MASSSGKARKPEEGDFGEDDSDRREGFRPVSGLERLRRGRLLLEVSRRGRRDDEFKGGTLLSSGRSSGTDVRTIEYRRYRCNSNSINNFGQLQRKEAGTRAGLFRFDFVPRATQRFRAVVFRAVVLRPAVRLAPVVFLAPLAFVDRFVVFFAVDFVAPVRFVDRFVVFFAVDFFAVLRLAVVLVDRLALVFFGDRLALVALLAVVFFAVVFFAVVFRAVDLVAPLRFGDRLLVLADRAAVPFLAVDRFFVLAFVRAAMEYGSLLDVLHSIVRRASERRRELAEGPIGENVRRFADRLTTETISVAGHCSVLKQLCPLFVNPNVWISCVILVSFRPSVRCDEEKSLRGSAPECDPQASRSTMIAVFTEIDTLPCAQEQSTAAHRNRNRCAEQTRFDMRRHVVRTFACVRVGEVFRDQMVHGPLKIRAHVRVGVLIERQGGRCVAQEEVRQADRDGVEPSQGVGHTVGDEVEPARHRRQHELGLLNRHCGRRHRELSICFVSSVPLGTPSAARFEPNRPRSASMRPAT